MDPRERASAVLRRYEDLARDELPTGVSPFDAHTHLGNDIDGMVGDRDELLAAKRRHGISRSFVFCLDEPDREPAFTAANDRTLDHASASGGTLVPFARLDLSDRPLVEAERALALGARGIKLHPRAQRFGADDPRLEPVFELAADRRVPILIHGGRGLPPIADDLARLVERHGPTLIIAHAGVVDMDTMARHFSGRRGVFFDTSVGNALDQLALFRLVPPEQIVYASDYPYGRHLPSLLMALRTCRASELDDTDTRRVLAENAGRIADGLDAITPSSPRGADAITLPLTHARISHYLSMTASLLWMRAPSDAHGMLGLAINACRELRGRGDTLEQIGELLEVAKDVWTLAAESGAPAGEWHTTRELVQLASTLAVTDA